MADQAEPGRPAVAQEGDAIPSTASIQMLRANHTPKMVSGTLARSRAATATPRRRRTPPATTEDARSGAERLGFGDLLAQGRPGQRPLPAAESTGEAESATEDEHADEDDGEEQAEDADADEDQDRPRGQG